MCYPCVVKAVVYSAYGPPDVLRFTDVDTPVPGDGEVLVKVRAASLNLSDWEALRGTPLYSRIGGLRRPRRHVLGSDIAGRVEAVGPGANRFRTGDDVFADILGHLGGFAEYVCVPEKLLEPMPPGMTHEQAAALPQAGAIALQGIRERGRVRPGHRVLINGAGGGSGMFAIQLAKVDGAEVTGVDNAEKQDFMREMGADHVLDYRKVDYTRTGERYAARSRMTSYRSAFAYRRALARGGRYLFVGGSVATLLQMLVVGPLIGRASDRKVRLLPVKLGVRHLAPLVELCRQGTVTTVIDRRFPLHEVPEALRYLGGGHAKGKVVITVEQYLGNF
jgi:NADPH:quinone reductase-like Zn-dependent oxidoreductase